MLSEAVAGGGCGIIEPGGDMLVTRTPIQLRLRLVSLRKIISDTAMPGSASADLSHGDDARRDFDLSKPQTSFAADNGLRDRNLGHLAREGRQQGDSL